MDSNLRDMKILELRKKGLTFREIAKEVLGRTSASSTVSDVLKRYKEKVEEFSIEAPNIVVLDLETAPCIGYYWQRWKTNILPTQVISESYILCGAYKYLNSGNVFLESIKDSEGFGPFFEDDYEVVKALRDVLDKADIVIAHNGDKFDIPVLNTRMVYHGLAPPSPYKTIDTLKIAKKNFNFPANSLNELGKYLKVGTKVPHSGFELWVNCLKGCSEAWDKMHEYNIGDIFLLEEVYYKLRAWNKNTPNMSHYYPDNEVRCVCCGSTNVLKTGKKTYTGTSSFDVYTCQDCSKHSRGRSNTNSKEKMANLLLNGG